MIVRFPGANNQAACFLALIILISVFSSCRRGSGEQPLVLPATPPLTRDCIGYAVVNVSFTHFLNEPDGVSLGYLRRGTVVRILERRKSNKNDLFWILAEGNQQASVSRGWLQETAVDIFDNESRAITASKTVSQ